MKKSTRGPQKQGPLVFLYVDICGKIHSYTDWHDVDEETRAITDQGGSWGYENIAGVALRNLIDATASTFNHVASSNI